MYKIETLTLDPSVEPVSPVTTALPSSEADTARLHDRVLEVVGTSDQFELEIAAKVVEKEFQREELRRHMLQQPFAALMIEMAMLSEESNERTIELSNRQQKITAFVTRTAAGTGIDAVYHTIWRPDGSWFHSIDTFLGGRLEQPLHLSTADDHFSATERVWRGGDWRRIDHSLEPGSRGYQKLDEFFDTTLDAITLAKTRTPSERETADRVAKMLVIEHEQRVIGSYLRQEMAV